MTPPINRAVLDRSASIELDFADAGSLRGFVVIEDFLSADALAVADAAADQAAWSRYCGYTPTGRAADLRREFREPGDDGVYVTVHDRPTEPIPSLEALREQLSTDTSLDHLRALTGLPLRRAAASFPLSAWGPGSFFQPHTDMSREATAYQLVISLSLTRRWRDELGGAATFGWDGCRRTVMPRHNTAVLFTPTESSLHWVDEVAAEAPPHDRLTWTMIYH